MKQKRLSTNNTLKKRRNFLFLVFVLISFVFWFLIKLSKTYIHTITYKVNYTFLPSNKIFQERPQEKMTIRVKGTGFSLINHQIRHTTLNLKLSRLRFKSKYNYYLTHEDVLKSIQKKDFGSTEIMDVLQDSLFVKLGAKKRKKIPVKPILEVSYKLGYKTFDRITTVPDSIFVEGPELQLSKIKYVATETYQAKELYQTIRETVALKLPVVEKVNFTEEEVKLHIPVDKITENTIEVPIEIINIPEGLDLVSYPKKVKVSYQVRLSEFHEVTAMSFKVICDFRERTAGYLLPTLEVKSSKVTEVKLQTKNVEYLIVK